MKLIRKEDMENYCNGKEYLDQTSINDDLELLIEDLRLGKEPSEDVRTYFLPKLTEEELELVEKKDLRYLQTLMYSDSGFPINHFHKITNAFCKCLNCKYPHCKCPLFNIKLGYLDVLAEMKVSESDSKFVQGICYRYTYTIENSSTSNCS